MDWTRSEADRGDVTNSTYWVHVESTLKKKKLFQEQRTTCIHMPQWKKRRDVGHTK